MPKYVVGLFEHLPDARRAVEDLLKSGYSREEISVVLRDRDALAESAEPADAAAAKHTAEVAGTGAVGGGAIGGLAGLLIGVGAIAIPGIGPLLAAGPLATVLVPAITGASVGGLGGALAGALTGEGVEEEQARFYAAEVESGGILVTVQTDVGRAADVQRTFQLAGAIEVESRHPSVRPPGAAE